jgi:hypothetical protein
MIAGVTIGLPGFVWGFGVKADHEFEIGELPDALEPQKGHDIKVAEVQRHVVARRCLVPALRVHLGTQAWVSLVRGLRVGG